MPALTALTTVCSSVIFEGSDFTLLESMEGKLDLRRDELWRTVGGSACGITHREPTYLCSAGSLRSIAFSYSKIS